MDSPSSNGELKPLRQSHKSKRLPKLVTSEAAKFIRPLGLSTIPSVSLTPIGVNAKLSLADEPRCLPT